MTLAPASMPSTTPAGPQALSQSPSTTTQPEPTTQPNESAKKRTGPSTRRKGGVSAFRGPPDVQEVGRMAYDMFLSDNGIFSLRTEYMRRVEDEVIDMCVGLFHAADDASGTFTGGGSESNYSALHAMREWARQHHPQAVAPEVIAPYSAHPTFSKGCQYFGLKLVRTPLGPDLRADVPAMARAIGANTIGVVGSAPCWPYGLYDPIEAIGELAGRHRLWMHVDACVGGYLAPFVESLGQRLPLWDFRVPAVQSISADLHKYGYCPKPASTVLWRSAALKRFHHVHPEDWPGGPYQMQGSPAAVRPAPSLPRGRCCSTSGGQGTCVSPRRCSKPSGASPQESRPSRGCMYSRGI